MTPTQCFWFTLSLSLVKHFVLFLSESLLWGLWFDTHFSCIFVVVFLLKLVIIFHTWLHKYERYLFQIWMSAYKYNFTFNHSIKIHSWNFFARYIYFSLYGTIYFAFFIFYIICTDKILLPSNFSWYNFYFTYIILYISFKY